MTWLDFGGQKSQQGVKVVKAPTSMLGHRIHILVFVICNRLQLIVKQIVCEH